MHTFSNRIAKYIFRMTKTINHNIYLLICFVFLLGCTNQQKKVIDVEYAENMIVNVDTLLTKEMKTWLSSADTSYTFGQGNDILNGWTPHNFDTISEEAFLTLRNTNNQSINRDSTSILFSDSLLTIQTAKARLIYSHANISKFGGDQWTVYNGFIEPFKLYLITHWLESSILTGAMTMIDSVSNISYSIRSVSDGPTEIPIVSNDGKYLMIYSYNYHYSNITVLESVEENENTGNFIEVTSFSVDGLIRDIGWAENNQIYFKLDYRNYFDVNLNKLGYYKSKEPINRLKWKKNND